MEVDDAPGGGDGAGSSPKPGGDDAAAAQQQSTEAVLSNCLERFASSDFIMEPEIFTQLKTYFQVRICIHCRDVVLYYLSYLY